MNVIPNSLPSLPTRQQANTFYSPHSSVTRAGVRLTGPATLQTQLVNRTAQVRQSGVQLLTNSAKDLFNAVKDGMSRYVLSWFSTPSQAPATLPSDANRHDKHQHRQQQRHLDAAQKKQTPQPSPSQPKTPMLSFSKSVNQHPPTSEPTSDPTSEPTLNFKPVVPSPSRLKSAVPPVLQSASSLQSTSPMQSTSPLPSTSSLPSASSAVTDLGARPKIKSTTKSPAVSPPFVDLTTVKNNKKITPLCQQRQQILNRAHTLTLLTKQRLDQERAADLEKLVVQKSIAQQPESTHSNQIIKLSLIDTEIHNVEATFQQEIAASSSHLENIKKHLNEQCRHTKYNYFTFQEITDFCVQSQNQSEIDCNNSRVCVNEINDHKNKMLDRQQAEYKENKRKALTEINELYRLAKQQGNDSALARLPEASKKSGAVNEKNMNILNDIAEVHQHLLEQIQTLCPLTSIPSAMHTIPFLLNLDNLQCNSMDYTLASVETLFQQITSDLDLISASIEEGNITTTNDSIHNITSSSLQSVEITPPLNKSMNMLKDLQTIKSYHMDKAIKLKLLYENHQKNVCPSHLDGILTQNKQRLNGSLSINDSPSTIQLMTGFSLTLLFLLFGALVTCMCCSIKKKSSHKIDTEPFNVDNKMIALTTITNLMKKNTELFTESIALYEREVSLLLEQSQYAPLPEVSKVRIEFLNSALITLKEINTASITEANNAAGNLLEYNEMERKTRKATLLKYHNESLENKKTTAKNKEERKKNAALSDKKTFSTEAATLINAEIAKVDDSHSDQMAGIELLNEIMEKFNNDEPTTSDSDDVFINLTQQINKLKLTMTIAKNKKRASLFSDINNTTEENQQRTTNESMINRQGVTDIATSTNITPSTSISSSTSITPSVSIKISKKTGTAKSKTTRKRVTFAPASFKKSNK